MAGAGGLAAVLLGGLIGFIFSVVAIVLVIYSFRTGHPRRGFVASIVALALSAVSVPLSSLIWVVVLSGRDTHGDPIDYGEMSPAVILVIVEAVALLASIVSASRQTLRRLA
jgi:hypothetical protein